jgi:hypothetical protein
MATKRSQAKLERQKREFVHLSRQALAELLAGRVAQPALRRWDERLEPYIKALGVCHDIVPDEVLATFGYRSGTTWSFLVGTLYFVDGLEGVAKRIRKKHPSGWSAA